SRHTTPTALIRRISDTLPTGLEQPSEPFRTTIRRGRKTVRLFAGSLSELNRHRVRNESDYCPTKIGSPSEMRRNTHKQHATRSLASLQPPCKRSCSRLGSSLLSSSAKPPLARASADSHRSCPK